MTSTSLPYSVGRRREDERKYQSLYTYMILFLSSCVYVKSLPPIAIGLALVIKRTVLCIFLFLAIG